MPCQMVHGTVSESLGLEHSCTANAGLRGATALLESMALYLPVHFIPQILRRPKTLLDPWRVLDTLLGALRSATFLTAFITSFWYTLCLTRTVVLARLFPSISHDFWDGPYGCVMVGSLICGNSIWIENGRRRGEMALYVMPRALRACLPDRWVRSGNSGVRMAERLTLILSLASLLTAATHQPQALRGLSKFALRYVTNGPNVAFWKAKDSPPPPDLEVRDTSKTIAQA
ncbi:hypothetical protein C8J57DRAFT_1132043 [Mycena rebaudengoi]|nr:hypothetical protein C8J57DRAFT_1132043 [Mycena rebaudengoi]